MNHSHPVIRQQKTPERAYHIRTDIEEEEEVELPIELEPIELPIELVLDRSLDEITAVVVNYQTRQLIETAVMSFREFYPGVRLVIVDNNSTDGSWDWIEGQANEFTKAIQITSNIGHGPALDLAFSQATTSYMFTFDSDVVFLQEGLLEQMLEQIEDSYAIGWLRWVNSDGVAADERKPFNKDTFCPYIHPYAALYNRDIYLSLEPFTNLGAPAVLNMRDAKIKGIEVKPFILDTYVRHLIAGTRRMWRGQWNPGSREQDRKWNKKSTFPI